MESSKIENQTLLKKFIAIFKKHFLTWEWMLVVVLIVVNLINISLSESYFNFENITNAIKIFLDKAIMALPLMMVLIAGEIDISIASIMGVAGVCMGLANAAGMPFYIIILIGMLAGTLCGLFNGILVTRFPELSSVIITLGNLILFRGIAFMTLENKAVTDFPQQITFFAWGKIGGIPFILIFFIIEAIFFVYLIHRTKFGRSLYAIGNNKITSKFSGLKTFSCCPNWVVPAQVWAPATKWKCWLW
jgi:rhamnose transport system permease protein